MNKEIPFLAKLKKIFTPIQHEVVLPDPTEETPKSGVIEITDEVSFIHEKKLGSTEENNSET